MQAEAVKATQRRTVWNVLRRNLSLTAGCLILLCVVFTALFPGLIASQSPTDQNLTAMLAAPSAEHIWGTDELGRDIFARVIWGTRYDLVIGLAAASVPFIVGTLIGLFTAYFGGILDTLFMRLVDVMMSFPVIVLIIAIVAVLGLAGGAHQAWSASVYTLGSDMFPKSDVASITGLSGMAGQIGSVLFQTAVGFTLSWFAAQGNASHGYDIIFMVCGSAYLAAFVIFSLIIPNINMVAPRER